MKDARGWSKQLAEPIFQEIAIACGRVRSMSGTGVSVRMSETTYVLDGRTIVVETDKGDFPFWMGLNGPRLFFVAYVAGIGPDDAENTFRFCFGGAEKVGWSVNYEPIDVADLRGGLSIWATCLTDAKSPLAQESEESVLSGSRDPRMELTAAGVFWATDVAMMVQSWIRTCQREKISRHPMDPAPL